MKLKTEMQDGCVHVQGCCIDEDDVSPLQAAILQHDAAAAHALMRALKESSNMWFSTQQNVLSWIEERADELMRGWGFES